MYLYQVETQLTSGPIIDLIRSGGLARVQATRLIITRAVLAFGKFISALCHSAIPAFDLLCAGRCKRREKRERREEELESSYYTTTTTTISGSRRGGREGDCRRARYWRGPLALTVCAGAHLPVAPSYLRRPPTLPHKREGSSSSSCTAGSR